MKLLCFLTGIFFFSTNTIIEKIEFSADIKQLDKGKAIYKKSSIYYKSNGDCITLFTSPFNFYILSNKLGELKIYDPSANTVLLQQDENFSSTTNSFYFFLYGKTADMGLVELGFIPTKTTTKENTVITEWKQKIADLKKIVHNVKLVHRDGKPIYLEYLGIKQNVLRKVYYYNYTKLNEFNFPLITTDITFNQKTSDSTITKTTYSNFKINKEANSEIFSFKIPFSAKKINN